MLIHPDEISYQKGQTTCLLRIPYFYKVYFSFFAAPLKISEKAP